MTSSRTASSARSPSTGSSSWASSPTPPATSPAAGSPGTSTSRSTAAWCSWSRRRASPSPSSPPSASRTASRRSRSGIAAAPFVSLVVVPAAFAQPRAARRARRRRFADAALEGPAAEGVEEVVERPLDPPRRRASPIAVVGDPARRADAAQRGRARPSPRPPPPRLRLRRHRVQRAADHARAAAALPGDPDLAAAAPRRARGDRGARGLRPRDPRHRPRDRRLRRSPSRSACSRSGRSSCTTSSTTTTPTSALGLALIAHRHGPAPVRGRAQPGGARARAGGACGGAVARSRLPLFVGWMLARRHRRPDPAHRGRLRRRRGSCSRWRCAALYRRGSPTASASAT